MKYFQLSEDDLPDYLEVVAAKRQELAPGSETGANGEGTEDEIAKLKFLIDETTSKLSEAQE